VRVRVRTLKLIGVGTVIAALLLVFDVDWQAVGAVAAAFGAAAAWQAAQASRETSRDALLALGYAIRPRVTADILSIMSGNPPGTPTNPVHLYVARAENSSEFDASDVETEVRFRNGEVVQGRRERLGPANIGKPGATRDQFDLDLSHPRPGVDTAESVSSLIVRFSDARRICRWEWRRDYFFRREQGDDIQGYTMWAEEDERLIRTP
jgi:hypothetical protein